LDVVVVVVVEYIERGVACGLIVSATSSTRKAPLHRLYRRDDCYLLVLSLSQNALEHCGEKMRCRGLVVMV